MKRNLTITGILLTLLVACTENKPTKQSIVTDNPDSLPGKSTYVDTVDKKSINPCISIISTSKQRFSGKEPILVSYRIKNVSNHTVTIWDAGFWYNNKIIVTDSNNIELPRINWGKRTLSVFSPGGDRNKNVPLDLAPNETDSSYEKYDIKKHFIFNKSGVYNITYLYHEIVRGTEIRIESNTLRTRIDK